MAKAFGETHMGTCVLNKIWYQKKKEKRYFCFENPPEGPDVFMGSCLPLGTSPSDTWWDSKR